MGLRMEQTNLDRTCGIFGTLAQLELDRQRARGRGDGQADSHPVSRRRADLDVLRRSAGCRSSFAHGASHCPGGMEGRLFRLGIAEIVVNYQAVPINRAFGCVHRGQRSEQRAVRTVRIAVFMASFGFDCLGRAV